MSGLEIRAGTQSLFAFERESGRLLAGVGWNRYRPWVHPLCTPAGVPVLREFPPDHPFHNGCFVGQHPVRGARGEANFWAVPPERAQRDPVFVRVGRVETDPSIGREALADGVRLLLRCVWRDERDEPLLEELRRIEVRRAHDAVLCTVASRKRAAYGPLEFPETKFGGIAVRVDPRLAPDPGAAAVRSAAGACGRAEVAHAKPSDFVAFESGGAPRFGLALLGDDPALPWFVRDYGLALWNPTWRRAIALGAGESWEVALRLVAYDGALETRRAADWRATFST